MSNTKLNAALATTPPCLATPVDFLPIAVIGLSAVFPGCASVQDYWRLLQTQQCALRPLGQQSLRRLEPTTQGGFIAAIDQFDPRHFKITPAEAQWIAPEHRLLLEQSWRALEYAGYTRQRWSEESVGVFVGICPSEYPELIIEAQGAEGVNAYYSSGSALSTAAGRLAYFYNFKGPCLSVDTACSSSLVALHQACHSLARGECSLAMVAGVNALLTEHKFYCFKAAKMLSPTGRCRPFDHFADGYLRGEGCGVVLLKPLAAALAAGDAVVALIQASAINQDGQSSSLTAPNGKAQEAVMSAALAQAQLPPEAIQYVEAHGTGTPLGDLVELTALSRVYASRQRSLLVGSVKANIGHLEAAAGMAGLIKLILSIQHNQVVPQIHCRTLNTRFDWQAHRMTVPTVAQPLVTDPKARRWGAVSSFGFSGSNAHVILSSSTVDAPCSRQRSITPVRWHRHCYWVKTVVSATHSSSSPEPSHPLLDSQLNQVDGDGVVFKTRLLAQSGAGKYLFDHRLAGRSLLPMAAFCELALAAAAAGISRYSRDSSQQFVLSDLLIPQPYWLHEYDENHLQTLLVRKEQGVYGLSFFLQSVLTQHLTPQRPDFRQAQARLTVATQVSSLLPSPLPLPIPIAQLMIADEERVDCTDFYRTLADEQLHYGPAFRVVKKVWRSQQSVYGYLVAAPEWTWEGYQMPVPLLDGCLQVATCHQQQLSPNLPSLLPVSLGNLRCLHALPTEVVCCCHVAPFSGSVGFRIDFDLYSVSGTLLLTCRNLLVKAVKTAELADQVDTATPFTKSSAFTIATTAVVATDLPVKTTVVSLIKELAGLSAHDSLDVTMSFAELGYDSLMSMQLKQRLQEILAIQVSLTEILFDHSLADFIQSCEQLVLNRGQNE